LLCVTIKLDSGDSFPHLIQKRRSQLGFVTYLLNYPRISQCECAFVRNLLAVSHGLLLS
jgi:hypothetical protein